MTVGIEVPGSGDSEGQMDHPTRPPGGERAPGDADNRALWATVRSEGGPTQGATDPGMERSCVDAAETKRDLVAAVRYYEGVRELFGATAEAPRLGKYTLERVLGCGAYGSVILGHNPDTGGEVAIKILHAEVRGERETLRLQREAQALARLAHPNIVPVFDAGIADGARYVVMRSVSGTTLRQAQKGKSWRQIVDLYAAAARGLAAVHAAGLIHRDFKADNVLVGDDGQVMLADFGLVRLADERGERDAKISAIDLDALALRLTGAGEVGGTPVYMSPEAVKGGPLGPQSDLFSVAASLFEALYGAVPFEGDNVLEILLAASEGTIRPRPETSEVPLWLDAVLRRALQVDPTRRHASIEELLRDLDYRARERAEAEAIAGRRRRRRFTIGLVTAASIGVVLGAITMKPEDPCAAPEAKIAAAWADRRAALEAAVVELGVPAAVDDWQRVRGLLDGYSSEWAGTYGAICRATFHDGAQSQELFDARVACLDQRRWELVSVARGLEPISEASLAAGLEGAARLESSGPCTTATRTPAPTETQRGALGPVRALLAEARRLERTSDDAGADVLATAAVRDARRIGYAPAIAEALFAEGRTKWLVRDGAAARSALMEALDLAEATALDDLTADAGSLLTKVSALELRDAALGDEWARQTQRKLARIDADLWRRAELLNNRGLLALHVAGDTAAALEYHRQALEIRERLPGEARLVVADSHVNLGNVLAARGDLDRALAHYAESQRLNREVLGEDHARVADDLYNRAATLYESGHYAEAEAPAERALATYQRSSVVADVADAHILLAAIFEATRRLSPGLAHARLAAQLLLSDPGAPMGKRAIALERVGSFEREILEWDSALVTYDRALGLLVGDDGRFAAERVSILVNRASTLANMRRFTEAHSDVSLALRLAGPGNETLARLRAAALRAEGRTFVLEHRDALAIPPLEEALELLETHVDPPARAEVSYLLAQALVAADGERDRALALAGTAIEFYRSTNHDELVADIQSFTDRVTQKEAP